MVGIWTVAGTLPAVACSPVCLPFVQLCCELFLAALRCVTVTGGLVFQARTHFFLPFI